MEFPQSLFGHHFTGNSVVVSPNAAFFSGLLEICNQYSHMSSLRSKRFQSSHCAKVRAEAKKKVEGGGGGEKRKRLPANPTILENAP